MKTDIKKQQYRRQNDEKYNGIKWSRKRHWCRTPPPMRLNTDRQCRSGVVLFQGGWCWFGVEVPASADEMGIKVVYFAVSGILMKLSVKFFWAKRVIKYYSIITLSQSSEYRVCMLWFGNINRKQKWFWNYFLPKGSLPLSLICSNGITNRPPVLQEKFSKGLLSVSKNIAMKSLIGLALQG